jgi:hypothetical protein
MGLQRATYSITFRLSRFFNSPLTLKDDARRSSAAWQELQVKRKWERQGKFDDLVKSQNGDGQVKSSICKARKT